MLSSFKVSNFRSIQNLELNLSFAEKRAPTGYQDSDFLYFLEPRKKVRLIPVLAVYGANASGKSNVLKALRVFADSVLTGIEGQFQPDKLNNRGKPTSFITEFIINGQDYSYELAYNRQTILSEVLKVDGEEIYRIGPDAKNFSGLSSMSYPEERLQEIHRVECCTPQRQQTMTFLSIIGKRYQGLHAGITALCEYLAERFVFLNDNSIHLSRGVNTLAAVLANDHDPEPLKNAFEQITSLLETLDIHISRMSIDRTRVLLEHDHKHAQEYLDAPPEFYNRITSVEKEGSNIVLNADSIRSFHQDAEGNEVEFDFTTEESSGTQIVAGLLGIFLAALKTGGTVIVDELDRSLHPLLLIELVRLFKEKRYNEHNAQLIFTVHNTEILDVDILRVSEVGIVRKTQQEGTELVRLSDFEGVSNLASFRELYLNGQFAGIPFPYI
ncbi:MAG: ATP-binding protein [Oxalobacter sp.]|nr:ATP-binding protein [Oxalobacter sp.]